MEKKLEQRQSDCLRIVLYGPESTGKTTLAKQLAAHFETEWVPEYMRSYLQEKWDLKKEVCKKEDLFPIAKGQMNAENEALKKANSFLFCDTNLTELKVYSEYYYDGFCPSEIVTASEKNNYTLYFLTYIDTPWEEDDLRDRPYDRSKLFRIFENELIKNNYPYVLLKGTQQERFNSAVAELTKLFNNHK